MTENVTAADQQDIAACLEGEGEAFARLMRRYQNHVAAQMRRFTREPVELDELVQDVFVEAYFSLRSFSGRGPFLHWLRRVATRVGYRFWKSRARRRENEESLTETALNFPSQPEELSSSEAAEFLFRLFSKLQPPDRLALTLFYFEECDIVQIAERTGWTRTGAKVRLHRARRRLEKFLKEAGIREAADV